MSNTKRYYWLKLKENFFRQPKIKKLRRIAGGDTYTIIYLKMQLLSITNNGYLVFEGIEDDFAEEVALTIDEDTENVRFTLMYLTSQGLLVEEEKNNFLLVEANQSIGSETQSATRVRAFRERQEALQSNGNALQCNTNVTKCNTEIEIEKEIEKEIEIELDKEKREDKENINAVEVSSAKSSKNSKPIRHKYGRYDNVLLTDEDLEKLKAEFPYDWEQRVEKLSEYMASTGKSYKNHLATIRNWSRNERPAKLQTNNRPMNNFEHKPSSNKYSNLEE